MGVVFGLMYKQDRQVDGVGVPLMRCVVMWLLMEMLSDGCCSIVRA